jgi:hypothetical protein
VLRTMSDWAEVTTRTTDFAIISAVYAVSAYVYTNKVDKQRGTSSAAHIFLDIGATSHQADEMVQMM